jgi:hypothetical protein
MEWMIGLLVVAVVVAIVLWVFGPYKGLGGQSSNGAVFGLGRNGHSVWGWQAGAWKMVDDRSAAGCVPGPAPTDRSKFEGEHVKVPSVPRHGG